MTVQQLLQDLQKGQIEKPGWQLSTYAQIIGPLLDSLESITGKTFKTYKLFAPWWREEGKKFVVLEDPSK